MKPRGLGRIFRPSYTDKESGELRRSAIWWIQYSFRSRMFRESSHSTNRSNAIGLLKRRLAEIGRGRLVGPDTERTTFEDLAAMLENDYRINGRRSLRRALQSLAHSRAHFATDRAVEITEDRVAGYIRLRQEEGARNATINRELAALKRAFRLGEIAQKVARVPHIRLLKEAPPRKGFFEAEEVQAVLEHLPEPVKPVIEVAYVTGWRVRSEILTRKWCHVDFEGGWLRLDPGETKNDEGRLFPLIPDLHRVLARQQALAEAIGRVEARIIEWVFFWPDGSPIHYFRRSWLDACRRAGLPGRIPHDLRRTAVRNLARAGVDRKTAMEMVGHKTESIYRRYMITDETMLRDGAARLAALLETERQRPRRVVPLPPRSRQVVDKSEGLAQKRPKASTSLNAGVVRDKLVAWDGVEPPTRGFSVRCSTN